MQCSICKRNEAIIHIHEYSTNGVKNINLCLECALKKGLNNTQQSVDKLFVNLIENLYNNTDLTRKKKSKNMRHGFTLICPACHTAINNFTDDLRVGCPTCYSIFENIIDLLIYKQNNSLVYKGKLPNELSVMKNHKTMINKLKAELKEHIKTEEYQKAAIVRDEIKKLKKNIQKRIRESANR